MPRNTVLVVEDDPATRDFITEWVTDWHSVRTAADGEEALAAVGADVDVVLLDRRLPDISGDEVLSRIRDRNVGCRVAMVTAVDPDFDILEMECDDYLVKPIRKQELRSTIDSLLDRASFDEKVQERYALSTRLATLELEKPARELERSEEYAAAKARLEDLTRELDTLVGRSIERGGAEMYHEIGRDDGMTTSS